MHDDKDYSITANEKQVKQETGKDKKNLGAQPRFAIETIKPIKNKGVPSFDWQAYVKDHPYLTLGIAAGTGILLASLFKPRLGANKRFAKTTGNYLVEASHLLERRFQRLTEKPVRVGTSMKTAAAAMATKALKTYLKRRIISAFTPGHKRRMWF